MSVLEEFYEIFGLKLNVAKTEIFICGLSERKMVEIQSTTGSKWGHLPVRCLGVPLVTRRLSVRDCNSRIEKISVKLNSWSSRKLSYGGRLQLI
ncbi:hypothetical protein V6N13_055021 [Hibiscus sabdariffa]